MAVASLLVALLSLLSTKISLSLADAPLPIVVDDAERRDVDVATYVVTFVVPFALVPTGSLPDVLAVVLIFIVVGLIAVTGATVLPNPAVQLFGYRWMTLVTPRGRLTALVKSGVADLLAQPSVRISTGQRATEGRSVRARHIGSGVWIVAKA